MGTNKSDPTERLGRAVAIGEIAGRALDPIIRQRGFATSELIANWTTIVPAPYDRAVMPDKLKWTRPVPDAPADGASLYVRVDPAHAAGFLHEIPVIRDAINRYFGFFLVSDIRTSREPFVPRPRAPGGAEPSEPTDSERRAVEAKVEGIADPQLREALARLGGGIAKRGRHGA